ncbi:iron chelate uptake ABC transporter family permease subunit [Brevibacillus choshinensis]|uniref:AraC family transcriptional regulator n=1 Tax=Brevibacillus choshinensis TaxID=54911 RepID=UPI002E1AAC4C|nr:iron chelate uptake ABC transporter family permease subunit [Brevibacillus choshinensis]MED4584303.1 iron chelate uptake ABC transporter family permease subunit [Brevibacillus choshinensis]
MRRGPFSQEQSCHQIGFIKNQKGNLDVDGTSMRVEAGDVVFIKPDQKVKLTAEREKEIEYFLIGFSYWKEESRTGGSRHFSMGGSEFPLTRAFRVRSHSQVLHLMEELQKSFLSKDEAEQFRQRLLFERILYILVKDMASIEKREDTLGSIEETIQYVEQHYMLNLTLETVASKAGVSLSYYSRMFKILKGVSFSDYITSLRISRAKVLLLLPASRLREVAQSVGYNDEFYFSKMFKKVVGLSASSCFLSYQDCWPVAVHRLKMRHQQHLHSLLIPVAAYIGALLIVVADSIGRAILPPMEVPVGIVTAINGAPYFLYLIARERKKSFS